MLRVNFQKLQVCCSIETALMADVNESMVGHQAFRSIMLRSSASWETWNRSRGCPSCACRCNVVESSFDESAPEKILCYFIRLHLLMAWARRPGQAIAAVAGLEFAVALRVPSPFNSLRIILLRFLKL